MLDDWISSLVGVLIGSIITITVTWFTTRAEEKRLKTQLLFDKKAEALSKLHELSNQQYKTYDDFKKTILSFADSFQGTFLPTDLVAQLRARFNEMDVWIYENVPGIPQYSDEEIQRMTDEYDEYLAGLDNYEKIEMEFKDRIISLKRTLKDLSRDAIGKT